MDTGTAILTGTGAVALMQLGFVTVAASGRGQNGAAWFLLTLAWTVGIFPAVCMAWVSSFTVAVLTTALTQDSGALTTVGVVGYAILGVLVIVFFVPLLAFSATAPRKEPRRRGTRITRSTSRIAVK